MNHSAWPLYKKLDCVKVSKDLVAPLGMKDQVAEQEAWPGNEPSVEEAWDTHPLCPFHDYHMVVYPESAVPEEGSVIDVHGPGW